MYSRDDLPGYRMVTLCRISDVSATNSTSLTKQDRKLGKEVDILKDEYDGELIKMLSNKQSASSMDREELDEIYKMAKNDEFDILMVWRVHRLTRAIPLETMRYIIKLMDEGIVLYSDRDGYYDWTEPDDNSQIMQRAKTSKEWRDEIHYGSISSNKEILRKGENAYGGLGYGLTTDDENKIIIKDGYDQIIKSIFSAYLGCESTGATAVSVKNKIDNDNLSIEPPSDSQVDTALDNELYIGELIEKKSEVKVREKEDLKVVDPEDFDKVQDIRSDVEEIDDPPDIDELPSKIYDLISRYGQEYIVDNVSGIRWCCPECRSTNIDISDTTIDYLGISIPRIYCNNEEICGYQGPVIRNRELERIDMSLPIICPDCQRTEDFDVEEINIEINDTDSPEAMYRYTCQHCGSSMIKDADPDPNVRGLNSSKPISLQSTKQDDTIEEKTKPDNQKAENKANIGFQIALEEYLKKEGPNKAVAREIMIKAANILADEGPMTRATLQQKLYESPNVEYSSADSLWQSIFMRYYTKVPGFIRVSHGKYDFYDQKLDILIDIIQDL